MSWTRTEQKAEARDWQSSGKSQQAQRKWGTMSDERETLLEAGCQMSEVGNSGGRDTVYGLRSTVSVVAVLLVVAGWALAQPAQQGPVFKYYVWGQVLSPGAYSLGGNPDLVELLSAAGGPTKYADVKHLVLVRASAQKQIRVDLKRTLAAGKVVPLSPGDVVMVPDSPWYTLREVLDVATTVTSFATLTMTILIFAGVGK
jgi:hypothetical protein